MPSTLPVLILDDEKDNLEALRRLLRNQYEVSTVDSPFEALKMVQKTEYSAIISDQRMPEMTGVEFLEKVKTLTPDSTRILLTGYTDLESVIGAINRGNIYRYIAKPWDPEDIKQTLRQACDSYLLRKELQEKNQALELALEEVRGLDQAKARFLSLVSHELNTPLTTLDGFLTLLHEESANLPPTLSRAVERITEATERLKGITADVIEYVRLGNDSTWVSEAFDWEKELVAAIQAQAEIVQARKLQVGLERKYTETVPCDPGKTRLALTKWVSEFLAAAPPSTQVRARLRSDPTGFEISLARQGHPLHPDSLKPLAMTGPILNHTSNLGLRLATCRFLLEQQGGQAFLENDSGLTRLGFRFAKLK